MHSIFIITGASGSGKTTLSAEVFTKEQKLITTTSRTIRSGEVEAQDYYFVDKGVFSELIKEKALVEHDEFVSGYYGLTKEELEAKKQINDVYILLNHNGAQKYKELFPESVIIFIDVDKDEAIRHMKARGDSELNIQRRMDEYEIESLTIKISDYIITNRTGKFEESVEKLKSIVTNNKQKKA